MQKFAIILTLGLASLGASAQPILVGHRGSLYGLENSEESFRNGIKLGYQYLETDVKFTKDNILVCSHDDDTKRLGGTKTLATSTLEELQSETLTQTRSGVQYTGRICSMKEYLEICKDGGVKPLIELKWTDGINSNDCSKIPLLIQQIEETGMRDKCMILTSMKPCLEYIRKNYPDIPLQFLTGQYWATHFDWCVEHNIDVDIQVGYFDKTTVQKYHDKGLKVNMWTTNDEAGYKTYGNMGCDYITTDYLDGHNLPELNEDIRMPHNTVDYPNSAFDPQIKGSYNVESAEAYAWPAEFEGKNVRRAVSDRQGGWYVLLHDAEKNASLFHLDEKAVPTEMSLEGIEGGEVTLNDIALTADGKLIGCNLEVVTNNAETTKEWKTYVWDGKEAVPAPFISTSDFSQTGNWISGRIGNSLAVSGRIADLKIYTTSHSTSGTTYRVCGLQVNNAEITNAVYALGTDYTLENWGDFHMTVAPRSQNNIIISAEGKTPVEYTFEWGGTRLPMTEYSTFEMPLMSRADAAGFFRYGTKAYAIVPSGRSGVAMLDARVYDVQSRLSEGKTASPLFEVCPIVAGAYINSGATVTEPGNTLLSVIAEGSGIYNFTFDPTEETPEAKAHDYKFDLVWIKSNTTGNVPEHIDGSNAQQGTAVNGFFYINDCSEQSLHIFDESGYLGAIPGGAGWGCTRDDAGNIIVRDDKNTSGTHKFIIYAAGARPDSYEAAVKFELTIALDGQTNFINASGNVLGDEGYIYMYPNKQSAIAIIEVQQGKHTNTYISDDLAFAGSTAGYVAPMGHDRENFIYQVRNQNINYYNGGASTPVIAGNWSATPPARNTTIGCAYVKEGGNVLFAHNSGTNYKGGLTVRDLTLDKVIKTIDPIGELGYAAGGNMSCANWLVWERIGDMDYYLYQYCPSNGFAKYHLYVESEKVEGISTDNAGTIVLQGKTAKAAGAEAIMVYDLGGRMVMNINAGEADLSNLPEGVYVLRASTGAVLKAAI
ncbi:MAG: hypothetical protein K2I69_05310 [Muribaculaceae bacterium]|nr:hypothetical protein [Muribaculaceae bacterium]